MYDSSTTTAGTTARRAGSYSYDRRTSIRVAALRASRMRSIKQGAWQFAIALISLAAGIALAFSPLADIMPAFTVAATIAGVIAGIVLGVIGAYKIQLIWL